jgi:hypothetical protein
MVRPYILKRDRMVLHLLRSRPAKMVVGMVVYGWLITQSMVKDALRRRKQFPERYGRNG